MTFIPGNKVWENGGVVLVSFAELFVIGSRPKDVATTTLFARRMVFEQGIQQFGRKPEEAFLQYINFLYRVYKYLRVFICGERPGTLIFAHRWEQVKRFQKSLSLRTIIAGGCRNSPPSPQINRCPYREVAKLPPCCNGGAIALRNADTLPVEPHGYVQKESALSEDSVWNSLFSFFACNA